MDVMRIDNWQGGANNIAARDRLPESTFREAVNLDAAVGGKMDLRSGMQLAVAGSSIRAAFGLGSTVIFCDGDTLAAYETRTDERSDLATVAASGAVAGAVHNGQLFLSTPLDSLRIQNGQVKPWAIRAPVFDVEIVSGSLPPGTYKVAVTAYGSDGEESGTVPMIVSLGAGKALRVSSSDARRLALYCSPANAKTLYAQGRLHESAMITAVADDSADLTTAHMVPMPPCEQLIAHRGVLVGRAGNAVFVTEPMRPHLVDLARGFFQYSGPVTMIAATDGGVYVAADKTWFLTAVETDQPAQSAVLEFGAVPGTALTLPDGRAAWFTRYGQALGNSVGQVELPMRKTYAPLLAETGAAGVLEHNGNQMIVTTMRGKTSANRLAAGDFCELEITDERH